MRRAFVFARHIPLPKLVRRIELGVRRSVRDRLTLRSVSDHAPPARAATVPLSLFDPRMRLAPTQTRDALTFSFLNREVTMPGSGIDWHAPGPGAENQLWRMNLHYMEFLEGVDDGAFDAFVADWTVANLPSAPGAWRAGWNSYALSLRAVVWMQEFARRGARIDDDARARAEASLATQVRFLERNLETDIGGNHLIKNIAALIWASAYFSGPEALRWRREGLRLLRRELARQILPDGMHYERSPSYHNQVFADLLECRHALGGDPLDGALDGALRGMAQASVDLAHPDGAVALFNDAGLTMVRSPAACLAAFATIYGPIPRARETFAFESAGYFGCRTGDSTAIVDCGRIAPDDLPAHGHGDVLSFEWSVGGARIIVDAGVFEYVPGQKRTASRSARSHNTLCLEDSDQADFFGAFRCGRRPNVQLRVWQPRASGFILEGSHDGFTHLPGRPRHVRRLEASATSLSITDSIEGRTERSVSVSFLLHPEVIVTRTGRDLALSAGATRITFTADAPFDVTPAVWWPDMGVEVATQRIVIHVAPGGSTVSSCLSVFSGRTSKGDETAPGERR